MKQSLIFIVSFSRSVTPPHKTLPSARGGPMEVGQEPYTRPAPWAHTTHRTSPLAYTTRYQVSPNHAHYSSLGRNSRDLPQRGITSNCSWSHFRGERHHNLRLFWGILDTGVVHLPRADIHRMECGRRRTPRAFYCLRRGRSRR